MKLKKTITMTTKDWHLVPTNPRQRDTEQRAKHSPHLMTAHPAHVRVAMAIWPGGKCKVDGHTRDYLWSSGLAEPHSDELIVDVWEVSSEEEAKDLYSTFDSQQAVEKSRDRMFGARREHGITLTSPFLKTDKYRMAMARSWSFIEGRESRSATESELTKYWEKELYLLDACSPQSSDFPSGIAAAALITFRAYPEEATEFWGRYAAGQGYKLEDEIDAVEMLSQTLLRLRANGSLGTGRASVIHLLRIALAAFDRYRSGVNYRAFGGGIKAIKDKSQVRWAKKAGGNVARRQAAINRSRGGSSTSDSASVGSNGTAHPPLFAKRVYD